MNFLLISPFISLSPIFFMLFAIGVIVAVNARKHSAPSRSRPADSPGTLQDLASQQANSRQTAAPQRNAAPQTSSVPPRNTVPQGGYVPPRGYTPPRTAPAQPTVKAPAGSVSERRPLEKRDMNRRMPEKPIAEVDACAGGSIHDGYHEGVTQFDNGRPAAVAGKLGQRLADEDERLAGERAAADNARRVMARISKLPPIAQGMVYSEILGKPKSEAR